MSASTSSDLEKLQVAEQVREAIWRLDSVWAVQRMRRH